MIKGRQAETDRTGRNRGLKAFSLSLFPFSLNGHIFSGESLLEQARRLMAPGVSSVSTGKP
jgi:hypothetical protein